MEIIEQCPETDVIFACVGGGGLISGIGSAVKQTDSQKCQLIGCMPQNSPEMCLSVKNDGYTTVEPLETLSDGSAGPFEPDSITFGICKEVIDEFYLVSEEEIQDGIRLMFQYHERIIEGAAAVALMGFVKNAELLSLIHI